MMGNSGDAELPKYLPLGVLQYVPAVVNAVLTGCRCDNGGGKGHRPEELLYCWPCKAWHCWATGPEECLARIGG